MNHILIAIGCDSYAHLPPLFGAECDAKKVFRALVEESKGFCDRNLSRLLLSPTAQELNAELESLSELDLEKSILTIFFAGHGEVSGNSLYLCMSDTKHRPLSVTAVSLSKIISLIQELRAAHANIIIDACRSGGVMGDFAASLSQENIGKQNTLKITLLAACTRDQLAMEAEGEGLLTKALAECIEGTTFIHDHTPTIELAAIAARICADNLTKDQQPTYWGINLSGNPGFCRNPHYSREGHLQSTLIAPKAARLSSTAIAKCLDIHRSIQDDWSPRMCRQLLADAMQDLDAERDRLELARTLAEALESEALRSRDSFRATEVISCCMASLLSDCATGSDTEAFLEERCRKLAYDVTANISRVSQLIDERPNSLIGTSGLGEFFALPLRITSIAGWAGWATHACSALQIKDCNAARESERLLIALCDKLGGSIRAMSESQAPGLLTIGTALLTEQSNPIIEEFIGRYFLDLCDVRGYVLRPHARPSDAIEYLIARSASSTDTLPTPACANPSELTQVIIALGALHQLDDAFDQGMISLDHRRGNAFVPGTYASFNEERIENGTNLTSQIGHDIWTLNDVRTTFRPERQGTLENRARRLVSAAASLLYKDRCAWHLLAPWKS